MKKVIKSSNEVPTEYGIPVRWQMQTILNVNAMSLEKAIKIVNTCEYDLPEGEYVEGSYEIDYERLEE